MKPDFYLCDHCKYYFDFKPNTHDQTILFKETDDTGRYKFEKCEGKLIPVNIVQPRRKGGSDFSGW